MELADRIKDLRIEKGLTYSQLGAEMNKSEGAARSWEAGRSKPDADTLIRLANYFECSVDYLLGLSPVKNRAVFDAIRREFGQQCIAVEFVNAGFLESYLKLEKLLRDFYTSAQSEKSDPDAYMEVWSHVEKCLLYCNPLIVENDKTPADRLEIVRKLQRSFTSLIGFLCYETLLPPASTDEE